MQLGMEDVELHNSVSGNCVFFKPTYVLCSFHVLVLPHWCGAKLKAMECLIQPILLHLRTVLPNTVIDVNRVAQTYVHNDTHGLYSISFNTLYVRTVHIQYIYIDGGTIFLPSNQSYSLCDIHLFAVCLYTAPV